MPEDFLDSIHRQIRNRLRELDGVQAEYDQLLAAASALGVKNATGGRASTATRGPRRASSAASRRRSTGTAKASTARATRAGSRKRTSSNGATPSRRSGSGKRAPRGANRDAVLAALRSKPSGASARELATSAGVGRVSTYQVLGRLESEGLVNRKERGEGPALYTTP